MSNPALCSSRFWSFLRPFAFSVLALLIVVPAIADSHARIVRLSYIDGDIELDKADGHGFTTAYLNMPIAYQSKLWARDGEAEVEFEDGSSIRLTPDTIVAFTDLSLDADGRRNTLVTLQQGTAYFDIRHRDPDTFELQFSHERVQLIKSARFRVDAEKGSLELATLKGEVQVSNGPGTEVVVKTGESIRLDDDDPGRYYLSKGIDAETYDGWDNERAGSHDQAVSAAADSGYNGVVYGLSDLTSYGNYFYAPGYGYMWRPNSMPLGWDPFGDGYWISYPGYGYTFVSGYPWGWAPYRYGSWQFVNGYGWCWAPGSNWNSWNTAPVFVSAPPHFRPPERPRHGSPVLVVSHGVATPAPAHQMIVDNDSLDSRRPHSSKIVTQDGVVIRQGQPGAAGTPVQPGATVPAQGFVSGTRAPAAAPVFAPAMPGTVIVSPVREPHGGGHGGELREGSEPNQGPRSAPMAAPATSTVSAPARTATPPTPPVISTPPAHIETHGNSPRMDSHVSAPAMHSGGMSSGGGMRSAGPSFSSSSMGAGHSAGGMSGGGGGGAHSSGGSSGGGSHR
jgi:hypothetical protein